MKVYIYRQLKRVVACLLALSLIFVQPACALAACRVEAELLNDRAAYIIGSAPLRIPGLVIPQALTGKGVIVGLADSGLDKGSLAELPVDLQSPSGRIPRVVMLKSFAGRQVPDDPIGHGTHMAGTIVGSGEKSGGQFKGIAPGASLYFQALLDKDGKIKIPGNLEDLFNPAYAAGVRIHVNGWGEPTNTYNSHTAQVDSFVYRHPDFLPIFGAGNDGPGEATLSSEANSKNALVVGSSQTVRPVFSPEALDAGKAARSSSSGPTPDGRIKPDLLAPGSANISLCSSLTTGNYEANPAYTCMGGTSMAASVAGGAAALLEEYLKSKNRTAQPSSALLKALLINGARPIEGKLTNQSGYGILDLAGTILPLAEGSFVIAEGQKDLNQGGYLEYRFQVSDTSRPFKATLAWIDPASASGSPDLVDNLDLEIVDPQGKLYTVKDFQGRTLKDRQNNVEQVVVDKPLAGQYTVRVRATNIAGTLPSTHYALVFGQALLHDVVSSVDLQSDKLNMASGSSLKLSDYFLKGSMDGGNVYITKENITAGSDVYISGRNLYIFGQSWESGGIQILQQDQGSLLVEMDPGGRQGGYYLGLNTKISLMLNDEPVEQLSDIPAGAKIIAAVNPGKQILWSLKASYATGVGYIEKVDWNNRTIKLLQDDTIYRLAPWCALVSQDSLVDSSHVDLPYGSINSIGDDTLGPGMKVTITVSPGENEIQCIKMERSVVVGTVSNLNTKTGEVQTEEGKVYQMFPGSKVFRDGKTASLKDIQAGDKISGVLLPGLNQFLELQAYSSIIYGRVVYYNPEQGMVYLFDSGNQFRMLNIPDVSYIISGGMKAGTALAPGKWVRAVLAPDATKILRADLAEERQQDAIKTFRSFDPLKHTIYMTDGSSYIFSSATQMTKAGYSITPDLLSSGEQIAVSTLACPGSSLEFLARAEVKLNSTVEAPRLEATAGNVNNVLVVRGTTTADRVRITRKDGSREYISVNGDGSFSRILPLLESEPTVSILAIDTRTGGLVGIDIEVQSADQSKPVRTYVDIYENPDRTSIERLASREIVSGVGNGSYNPGQAIARADFVTMLGKAGKWQVDKSGPVNYFADNDSIPDWALGPVYFARQRGFISGYPDGSFKPRESLSRESMVTVMAQILPVVSQTTGKSQLPYTDYEKIPAWAEPSYQLFYQRGWLDLFGGGSLEPERSLTRGEAARFIDRIMLNVQSTLAR
ncbi:MAG: S8 family serine peptidase [Syntrophomonadaceae bacterium]